MAPGGARARAGRVYLGIRAVGLVVLALVAGGSRLVPELTSWDAAWLLTIAEHGYDGVPTDMLDAFGNHTPDTPLGFFPGYPALVAAVGVLTGGNLVAAGLLVACLARRCPGTAVAVVVAATLAWAWFGGYALTIWPYGI